MEQDMRFSPIGHDRIRALSAGLFMIAAAACGQTSAEPSPAPASPQASTTAPGCAIALPEGLHLPQNLHIETCQQTEKMTTFRGKVQTGQQVDTVFADLKSTYEAAGFTLYDNSAGSIRSVIFGGAGHRKGEIQLNPKSGYLAISINLYPEDMQQ